MSARILVVDDEQLMTVMLSALLTTEGYEVVQAPDGARATEILAEVTPDVILCDLAMPTMDGFELLQWVRRNARLRQVPFVVVTAHGEIENRMEALQLGADDFILKPFNTSELVAKVNGLVARVRQARELSRTRDVDLAGDLSEVPLSDVLHILELSHKTGCVHLTKGGASGEVYFADGQPVHAQGGGWVGDDALLRFLTWGEGRFEFSSQEVTEERSTATTTHQILVEGVKFLGALESWWGQSVRAAGEEACADILRRHASDLNARDRLVFEAIDSRRTLAEIAERLNADRFDAFMSLRTLMSLGLVAGMPTEEMLDPLGILLEQGQEAGTDRRRVLVVDGSAPYRQALVSALNASAGLQAIGAVGTGDEAIALIRERDPAVVTLDLNLPGEDGIRLLKRIMVQQPRPVVVVSALTQEGSMAAFECLRYGAVDFTPKQSTAKAGVLQEHQSALIGKIQSAAGVRLENLRRVRLPRSESGETVRTGLGAGMLVAVGSGVGGIGALMRLVAGLPAGLAASLLVVQHLMESALDPFVAYVQRFSSFPVRRATNDAVLEPGTCYVACSDHYVNLEPGGEGYRARLRVGPRPALFQSTQTINWAFFSVAETCGSRAVSVILAGQSEDGTKGAAEIRRAGGGCIVQDPETCVAPDMPRAALNLSIADEVVPDGKISLALARWLAERPTSRVDPAGSGR